MPGLSESGSHDDWWDGVVRRAILFRDRVFREEQEVIVGKFGTCRERCSGKGAEGQQNSSSGNECQRHGIGCSCKCSDAEGAIHARIGSFPLYIFSAFNVDAKSAPSLQPPSHESTLKALHFSPSCSRRLDRMPSVVH